MLIFSRFRGTSSPSSEITTTDLGSETLRSSFPALLHQEKPMGGNICEYTHVWEVRPPPLSPSTIYPKKAAPDVFTDITTLQNENNQKEARIYESHLAAIRNSRIICQEDTPTPVYFQMDPNTPCNHCTS